MDYKEVKPYNTRVCPHPPALLRQAQNKPLPFRIEERKGGGFISLAMCNWFDKSGRNWPFGHFLPTERLVPA